MHQKSCLKLEHVCAFFIGVIQLLASVLKHDRWFAFMLNVGVNSQHLRKKNLYKLKLASG